MTSTKDLHQLSENYSRLDNLLFASRSLARSLVHSNKSDTWYLETAFLVLCCTIGWLVFRRILYGPGYWLLYSPLTLFIRLLAFLFGQAKNPAASRNLAQSEVKYTTSIEIPSIVTAAPDISHSLVDVMAPLGKEDAVPSTSSEESSKDSEDRHSQASLADESRLESDQKSQDGVKLRARTPSEIPNPKKRNWEEPETSR